MKAETKDCNSCGMYNIELDSAHCERCGFNLCDDSICLYAHVWDHHKEVLDFLKTGFWEDKEE